MSTSSKWVFGTSRKKVASNFTKKTQIVFGIFSGGLHNGTDRPWLGWGHVDGAILKNVLKSAG
jgi:hypothetical protein